MSESHSNGNGSKLRQLLYNEVTLAIAILAAGFWFFTWTNSGFAKNDPKIGELDNRLIRVEEAIKDLPNIRNETRQINSKLDTLIGQVQIMLRK